MSKKVRVIRVLEYNGSKKKILDAIERSIRLGFIHLRSFRDFSVREVAVSEPIAVPDLSKVNEALEGSIKKWEKIVKRIGTDDGANNCDLCKANRSVDWNEMGAIDCTNCVVSKNTGKSSCCGTPYSAWISHQIKAHPRMDFSTELDRRAKLKRSIQCDTCEYYAIQELEYLKSLR